MTDLLKKQGGSKNAKLSRVRARYHLEEKLLRRLEPPASGNKVFYDDTVTGFGLRVTQAGARSWVFNYVAPGGRERRLTIGRWPTWSAGAAREEAKLIRRRIDRGEDPLDEKQQHKRSDTFATLAKAYLAEYASGKRSGAKDVAYLERDVLPRWRNLKARDIERRDVLRLVEAKAKAAPISANRLLAVLRKCFAWGLERDYVSVNPCIGVKAPGKAVERDRVLSAEEIRELWTVFQPGSGVSMELVNAVRLVLATAQRPGEVCGMEWSEVDLAGGWWTIPSTKAKNKLAHRVPLNGPALEILRTMRDKPKPKAKGRRTLPPKPAEGSGYVFAARADKPMETNALSHALRRRWALPEGDVLRLTMAHFTPHDLRRTAASGMASGGVQRFVIGRVLNHAEVGVTRVYDRHSYDQEKRAALDVWGVMLAAAIEGKPVQVDAGELER